MAAPLYMRVRHRPLTPQQLEILRRANQGEVRSYNGRARRSIERLERKGYIVAEYDMIPQAKGNGMELVQRITVRKKT